MTTNSLTLPDDAVEKHADFVAQARAARKKMLQTGLGHDADAVHAHLRQRVNATQSPDADTLPFTRFSNL